MRYIIDTPRGQIKLVIEPVTYNHRDPGQQRQRTVFRARTRALGRYFDVGASTELAAYRAIFRQLLSEM